jgi:hypothetical protein
MRGKNDFMTPEDRAQKQAEIESKRQAWLLTKSNGRLRYVFLNDTLPIVLSGIVWGTFFVYSLHGSFERALSITVLLLAFGWICNLVQWYRNERRFKAATPTSPRLGIH